MFEHKDAPLIPTAHFIGRVMRFFAGGVAFIIFSLVIGIVGYRYTEGMAWIDALLNAAMIAGGMGPVDALTTTGGKLFASFYAVYSGLFLIAVTGFLLAPLFHRTLHKFHQSKKP